MKRQLLHYETSFLASVVKGIVHQKIIIFCHHLLTLMSLQAHLTQKTFWRIFLQLFCPLIESQWGPNSTDWTPLTLMCKQTTLRHLKIYISVLHFWVSYAFKVKARPSFLYFFLFNYAFEHICQFLWLVGFTGTKTMTVMFHDTPIICSKDWY